MIFIKAGYSKPLEVHISYIYFYHLTSLEIRMFVNIKQYVVTHETYFFSKTSKHSLKIIQNLFNQVINRHKINYISHGILYTLSVLLFSILTDDICHSIDETSCSFNNKQFSKLIMYISPVFNSPSIS